MTAGRALASCLRRTARPAPRSGWFTVLSVARPPLPLWSRRALPRPRFLPVWWCLLRVARAHMFLRLLWCSNHGHTVPLPPSGCPPCSPLRGVALVGLLRRERPPRQGARPCGALATLGTAVAAYGGVVFRLPPCFAPRAPRGFPFAPTGLAFSPAPRGSIARQMESFVRGLTPSRSPLFGRKNAPSPARHPLNNHK